MSYPSSDNNGFPARAYEGDYFDYPIGYKRRKLMATEKLISKFYSTRSAIEHPQMLSPTIESAIAAAQRKLSNNGEEDIYIVQIVKIVRKHRPVPQFDVIDVK